jgi:hypothetical protein
MMLAAAVAAAALGVAGCDRPNSSQSRVIGTKDSTEIARPVDKSVADNSSVNSNTSSLPSSSMPSSTPSASGNTAPSDTSNMVAMSTDDAAITSKVTQAIMADPALKPMPIRVDTKSGTVTLSGSVDTPDMRSQAHQIAANTPGVSNVVDNLAIKNAG